MSATVLDQRPQAMPTAIESNFARAVVVWGVYALVVVATVRPVGLPLFDPDVWWHLRVGEWVVANGTVPTNDPFSLPGQTKAWVAYSWLYEVLLHGLHYAFGLAGIVVYRLVLSLLVVAAVHSLVRRLSSRWLAATALTALATLALLPLMSERPWLFTILFATLTLHAVLEMRNSERPAWWVWTLPLAYVLWANIHIQFIYGLFLFFLGAVAAIVDARIGRSPDDDTAATAFSRGWRRLILLAALCTAATLVNPYGAKLYFVVVEYATQPGPFRFVNELRAPEFREPTDWLALALTAAACVALGRRRATAFEVLLLTAAAFFAFRARRDVWFLALADVVILATTHGRLQIGPTSNGRLQIGPTMKIVAGLLALALVVAWARDLSPAGLERRVKEVFPVPRPAQEVRDRNYPGPLYNDFNWGGYLIYALPDLPVAIDGRTNLHGDERIERYGRTWCVLPGWREDADLGAAGVVIAPLDSALAEQLRHDGRFVTAHTDDVAIVFTRR